MPKMIDAKTLLVTVACGVALAATGSASASRPATAQEYPRIVYPVRVWAARTAQVPILLLVTSVRVSTVDLDGGHVSHWAIVRTRAYNAHTGEREQNIVAVVHLNYLGKWTMHSEGTACGVPRAVQHDLGLPCW